MMNNEKSLLQELQDLKTELESILLNHDNHEYDGMSDDIDNAIRHVQDLINHCIEIQLMVTKEQKSKDLAKNFYKKDK
jgi:hypothetical protein